MTTKWKVSDDEASAWIECSDAIVSAESTAISALAASPSGLAASDLYAHMETRGTPKANRS